MERPPRWILGCGNFGGIGSAPAFFERGETRAEAFSVMDAAWALGLDWFDTADAYGGGRSESWIGDWIRTTGSRPRITTKTYNPMEEGADHGLRRGRVLRQLETSLGRLGVDHVDLYLAHEHDPDVPPAELVATFGQLRDGGAIRAWGVSNFDAAQLRETLEHGRPAAVQNSYSLLDRRDEEELLPLCAEHGIAYQAFGPLAGGWLTGKYRRDEPAPPGSRMTMRPEPYRHLDDERVYSGIEALERFARGREVSTAALALAWVTASVPAVVGPRRPEHLETVREAASVRLSPAERDELGSLFPRWPS
ncbi:MAG: aldo/keto reductase [Actinomycetota bacterium]|nr:aldo/keto reductase [Actinomycetota bacterium]